MQQVKAEFRRLVVEAFKEGLEKLEPVIAEKRWIDRHYNWPKISAFSGCGLPNLYESNFETPTDYSRAFAGDNPIISEDNLASFQNLLLFSKSHECILGHLVPDTFYTADVDSEFKNRFLKMFVYSISGDLIDRYIHINKTCKFMDDAFKEIYEPYERSIFQDILDFDIYIPILFLKFDFDEIELGPDLRLEKMNTNFQLARTAIKSYGHNAHECVLSAATHALVLKNWSVKNQNQWALSNLFSEPSVYPIIQIDKFFAALRIVTGFFTGYAQILLKPKNWVNHYKADLPSISGTSIVKYPDWFENYYWNNENIPEIREETARVTGGIYLKLINAKENSIDLACKRLNLCFLRDDEQDLVIDAIIGLETLLSDDNRQEMTHKLAMRIGALTKLAGHSSKSPYQVFREVKELYSFRSAIIHGSTKADKKREIISDEQKKPISPLAIDYLKMVLRVLLDYPQYRDPEKIDEELLLAST